jgi:hypothetical protein
MTTGETKEPYTWDNHGSIVKAMQEVRESTLLTSQEKRLWNIALSALEIVFAAATESEQAEEKAWEESPDGIAHALARAMIAHGDLASRARSRKPGEEELWSALEESRVEIIDLTQKYRKAVGE